MKLGKTKQLVSVMMCVLAVSAAAPAMPAYAGNRSHMTGSRYKEERRMREAAKQVQNAFDKKDFDKLDSLCAYPVAISFTDGTLAEVKNKAELTALGNDLVFSQAMRDSIASTNVAKLESVGGAGAQMGDDFGLALYKINGKWKVNNIYLASASGNSAESVDIGSLPEMAEQIQKTCSYRSLDTLKMMCNYPLVLTYENGTSVEIQTPQQLAALGEERVFTDKLLTAIDQTDVGKLQEVGDAGVQMGGDSGLNLYKFNGYWKINQIYQ